MFAVRSGRLSGPFCVMGPTDWCRRSGCRTLKLVPNLLSVIAMCPMTTRSVCASGPCGVERTILRCLDLAFATGKKSSKASSTSCHEKKREEQHKALVVVTPSSEIFAASTNCRRTHLRRLRVLLLQMLIPVNMLRKYFCFSVHQMPLCTLMRLRVTLFPDTQKVCGAELKLSPAHVQLAALRHGNRTQPFTGTHHY